MQVAIASRGDGLHVSVADSGPGISKEDQVRVFEPFERGERASEEFVPGLGLGLAVVRDLATAIGARVELSSASGAGSTFTVVLLVRQRGRPLGAVAGARGRPDRGGAGR